MKKKRPSEYHEIDVALICIEQHSLLQSVKNKEEAALQVALLEHLCMYLQNLFLTYWRKARFEDAKEAMTQILDRTREATALVRKYRLSLAKSSPRSNEIGEHDLWFDFGRSALVGYLIHSEFESIILRLCRSTDVPELVLDKHSFHIANMNLALSISAGKKISGYDEFVCDYFKNPRIRLAKKSYLDYGKLIEVVSKSQRAEVPELIAVCEANYLKRADDKAFNNFTTHDGINGFNNQHVDYRLAAILKWAYRDYPTERKKLKTIHQWKWD